MNPKIELSPRIDAWHNEGAAIRVIMTNDQIPIFKQYQMNKTQNSKQYNLEERTTAFARYCRDYIKKLPRTLSHIEYGKQLIRSSGSQAANYIEANESLSKKDFYHRIRICRKETKESRLWLNLTEPKKENQGEQEMLIKESTELILIFSSIVAHDK